MTILGGEKVQDEPAILLLDKYTRETKMLCPHEMYT